MTNSNVFAAYRLGVRLQQLAGLPELPESQQLAQVKAGLWQRLLVAAEGMRGAEGVFGVVVPSILASQESLTRYLYSPSEEEKQSLFATMQTYSSNWTSELIRARALDATESAPWFELGVEIVNGTDNYSEGRPTLQTGKGLVFLNPRPHRWDLTNPERVDALIRRLDIAWEDVFRAPDGDNCGGDLDNFPEDFGWAWGNIEHALRTLAVRLALPVWNDTDRTLTIGNEEVRRFTKEAANQMRVIQAFVEVGWRRTADCPFGDSEERRQALTDLNKSIRPKRIVFRATGDNRLRWSRS